MNYQTVYDFADEFPPLLCFIPLVFMVAGVVMLVAFYSKRKKNPGFPMNLLFIGSAFAVIGFIGSLQIPRTLNRYLVLKTHYHNNDLKYAAGETTWFKQASTHGNSRDEFSVDSVKFIYSNKIIGSGFNATASKNGPVYTNGQEVRVSYVEIENERIILKLEIAR